jgi:hypothetical protein
MAKMNHCLVLLILSSMMMMLMSMANAAKMNVLVMNDDDEIVGERWIDVVNEDPPAYWPSIPQSTPKAARVQMQLEFPIGSPNLTVSKPWLKNAHTCELASYDSTALHHFAETRFAQTNDPCQLPAVSEHSHFTWLMTDDYQASFGAYKNILEFGTKHANLAMTRTGFVGGELWVRDNGASVVFNLDSGTYTKPIARRMEPDDPLGYIERVFLPKARAIFAQFECGVTYDAAFTFPADLPTYDYVDRLCRVDPFVTFTDSFQWTVPPHNNTNMCQTWQKSTCQDRRQSTPVQL